MQKAKLLFLAAALTSMTGCRIDFPWEDVIGGGGGGGGSEDPGGDPGGDPGEEPGGDPVDPPPPVLVPEPSSYFPFDEAIDGDLCERCEFVPGLFDEAMVLPGALSAPVAAVLPDGDAATSDGFTLSFWALSASAAPTGVSFSVVMLENLGLEVAHYDTGHSVMMYDGRYGGVGHNVPADHWTHFAVTSDGETTTLYIDGQFVSTQPGAGRHATNIRVHPGVPVDELRIYDSVLSVEQIDALHRAGES